MNSRLIERYTTCEVEVLYLTDSGQYRDKGTLTEFDGEWLALEKPTNELFLVPVSAIRIVKVLGGKKDPETVLLRPVDLDDVVEPGRLTAKK